MSKIEDKIISAVVGYKVTSISLDLEQMLNLITEHYISVATTDEEYNAIKKTVKGGLFLDKELNSKDNRYKLRSMTVHFAPSSGRKCVLERPLCGA